MSAFDRFRPFKTVYYLCNMFFMDVLSMMKRKVISAGFFLLVAAVDDEENDRRRA